MEGNTVVRCPYCGASVLVPVNVPQVKCPYCGYTIVLQAETPFYFLPKKLSSSEALERLIMEMLKQEGVDEAMLDRVKRAEIHLLAIPFAVFNSDSYAEYEYRGEYGRTYFTGELSYALSPDFAWMDGMHIPPEGRVPLTPDIAMQATLIDFEKRESGGWFKKFEEGQKRKLREILKKYGERLSEKDRQAIAQYVGAGSTLAGVWARTVKGELRRVEEDIRKKSVDAIAGPALMEIASITPPAVRQQVLTIARNAMEGKGGLEQLTNFVGADEAEKIRAKVEEVQKLLAPLAGGKSWETLRAALGPNAELLDKYIAIKELYGLIDNAVAGDRNSAARAAEKGKGILEERAVEVLSRYAKGEELEKVISELYPSVVLLAKQEEARESIASARRLAEEYVRNVLREECKEKAKHGNIKNMVIRISEGMFVYYPVWAFEYDGMKAYVDAVNGDVIYAEYIPNKKARTFGMSGGSAVLASGIITFFVTHSLVPILPGLAGAFPLYMLAFQRVRKFGTAIERQTAQALNVVKIFVR